MIKSTSDKSAVVDTAYHWIPISESKPPRGQALQLINRARGIPARGMWDPGSEWTHWAPYPTFRKDEK